MTVQLSGIFNKRHRTAIGALVDEIIANQGDKVAMRLMPIKNTFAMYIEHEIVHGFGGLTNERSLNSEGLQIAGMSTESTIFKPGAYQEFVRYNEKDLLDLRKAGTFGERGATGMTNDELDQITRAGRKLMRRIENRIQKLIWDAFFTGKFVYMGTEFSFGIPAGNTIAAESDWSVAATATPYLDLVNVIEKNPLLRKYKFSEIIMNGNTAADILMANSVQKFVSNVNIKDLSAEEVRKFAAPGLPPMTVVKDSYQEESLVNGKIVLGNAEFFVPDNKVLLIPDLSKAEYNQFGDFELTENLNDPSATLDRPAVGTYVFTDEEGLNKRQSPHLKVIGGFNGGPNLKRPKEVFVLTV